MIGFKAVHALQLFRKQSHYMGRLYHCLCTLVYCGRTGSNVSQTVRQTVSCQERYFSSLRSLSLLSRLSSSCCHVLMSCSICPVPTVQPRMPCPSCPVLVGPKSAVLFLFSVSCPGCPADVLSQLGFLSSQAPRPVRAVMLCTSSHICPVPAILSLMLCVCCPIRTVLYRYRLSSSCCPGLS
jgi:hypothetical protein